ncbi:chemotaxis protein CheD [Tyzzerella sp. OttesenSCG-928-J15]|nr:chemotaxis protein CheD [Tyzzerella sp. OttesenSCG-928-J15]
MGTNMIVVGMADLNATRLPGALTTLGLGSCVGIALYDSVNKVAGLAHAMLPDSSAFINNNNRMKYVDTSIVDLINKMRIQGARKEFIKAKVAGGAQMFAFNSTNESMRIGDRNVEATLRILRSMNIPVISRETGDNFGRTVELYSEDGRFVIKTINHGTRII